ncbi:hypothetical protein [uncultured Polaribacter sp.]|uniref:hypothetical protein n=1 Tax=uncultured Polaribacter sp. TaxID=174711 RepID=UPI00262AF9CA|nr:hypothetical protein [uncultured Polaribacter sp.]
MGLFKSLKNANTDDNLHKGKDYVDASYKYWKLKIFQSVTRSLSTLVKLLAIGAFLGIGLLFVAIAFAIFLGDVFNSVILGYLAVGGLFLIISFGVFLFRRKIDTIIITKMAPKFFKK